MISEVINFNETKAKYRFTFSSKFREKSGYFIMYNMHYIVNIYSYADIK